MKEKNTELGQTKSESEMGQNESDSDLRLEESESIQIKFRESEDCGEECIQHQPAPSASILRCFFHFYCI